MCPAGTRCGIRPTGPRYGARDPFWLDDLVRSVFFRNARNRLISAPLEFFARACDAPHLAGARLLAMGQWWRVRSLVVIRGAVRMRRVVGLPVVLFHTEAASLHREQVPELRRQVTVIGYRRRDSL